MAGKKDKCVVCVTSDLKSRQAHQLVSEIAKAKNKVAPLGRSMAAVTTREGVGGLLSKGRKMLTGK